MEIQKALDYNSRSIAKYAAIHTYEGCTTLRIRETPYCVSTRGWDNTIALKDVEYNIVDGVLYVKGTKIYHYSFKSIFDLITVWGKRNVWKINQDLNSRLVDPFTEEEIVLRKLWPFSKTVKGIDFDKCPELITDWYLSKEEYPYEIAISNFKLIEI